MQLTPRIEKALRRAAIAHDGQYRKGSEKPPYIIHPVAVALMVSEHTDDEDTIIAALLHDTIEDTSYTAGDMRRDFGERVVDMVEGVSETKKRDGVKLPWKERKESYLHALRNAPKEALLVSAADKTHNLRSVLEEEPGGRAKLFSTTSTVTVDDYIWYHTQVIAIIKERCGEAPLLRLLENVFDTIKKSIQQ